MVVRHRLAARREGGHPLGFQITFFRARPGIDEANPSRFAARQVLFAHAAFSDPKRGELLRDERSAREGFGLAEARPRAGSMCTSMTGRCASDGRSAYRSRGARDRFQPGTRPVAPPAAAAAGRTTVSVGRVRSRSRPATTTACRSCGISGSVAVEGRTRAGVAGRGVVRSRVVHARSWTRRAKGWDWVGVNLDDGGALMASRMRDARGGEFWAAGDVTRRQPGAAAVSHAPEEIEWTPLRHWRSPRTGVALSGRMESPHRRAHDYICDR